MFCSLGVKLASPPNVFGKFVEARDIVKRAVMFIGCCLGRASLLYTSSFMTDEVNL